MKKFVPSLILFILTSMVSYAQVGINTDNSAPNASAGLDVKFTNKGFLPPRIALTAMNAASPVATPADGLLVYNTATAGVAPNNVMPGYYCWKGTKWVQATAPQGSNIGDMQYWNGTQWIPVPVGSNGQVLTLYNGVPVWGGIQLPVISTMAVTAISSTTAVSGGELGSNGGTPVSAVGVCWNTLQGPNISNSHTSDVIAPVSFASNITNLVPNTLYYVRAYATNSLGTSYGNELSFTTQNSCGNFTINHVAGAVAPVSKTVTYGTTINLPGEPGKCWTTSNLGADHQATAVDDATEPSAGWYFQFNHKQGYQNVGGNSNTPSWTITAISETSDWIAANDPCTIVFGSPWRIPTSAEWTNADAGGNWTNWTGPWNSGLKLHAAGYVDSNFGSMMNRGSLGYYWSSTNAGFTAGNDLQFNSSASGTNSHYKAFGTSVRCVRNN
jgi:hypothetical protein